MRKLDLATYIAIYVAIYVAMYAKYTTLSCVVFLMLLAAQVAN